MVSLFVRYSALVLSLLLFGCAPPRPPPAPEPQSATATVAIAPPPEAQPPSRVAGDAQAPGASADPGPIPVTRDDPQWGSELAPVTIVEFSDFECPFCAKATSTLSALQRIYGPLRLRIVWKNNPLPFHRGARHAAEAGMGVFEYAGSDGFWKYHDAIFGGRGDLDAARVNAAVLSTLGLPLSELEKGLQLRLRADRVDAGIELAKALGANGTPAFFINGIFLSGAQPIERFRDIIDPELSAGVALLSRGTPASRLYAARVSENFLPHARKDGKDDAEEEEKEDTTVYRVPIQNSPVRGKPAALVTIVMFSDYQCPFCIRAHGRIQELQARYGDKIRVVLKHNPLPFHPRAEPAAQLALEARAQKGNQAFWTVSDLLFDAAGKLEDPDLEAIARQGGLNVALAMRAVMNHRHAAQIETDQDLSDDLKASGTPHFFINGRRLVGAQPIEVFERLIDQQLAEAKALLGRGVAATAVYDAIQKKAVGPVPPAKVHVPAPTRDNPSRGPAHAKVTIQIFSDFQCPFCKRVEPTLKALEAAFPGKIRFVWRNLPLPMHPEAQLAAEASMEAFRQKGAQGFWKMHERLFQDQSAAGLGRAGLDQHAAALGLDLAKFAAALDGGAHVAAVDNDKRVAQTASIRGTPAFVINDYFLSGAQPLAKFKKIVRLALGEKK